MDTKKFKIVTMVGIRPSLIRMSGVIDLLDKNKEKYNYEHIFVHTGQHFDYELDEVFYEQMKIRKPDFNLEVGKTVKENGGPTTFEYQMGVLFPRVAEMLEKVKPDLVVYVGDTNTELSSIVVSRHNVPVAHIESGGRSYDWRMPEEKVRTITDHLSDVCYAYTQRYKDILLSEGISENRIKIIGNIIYDPTEKFIELAENSSVLEDHNLEKKNYILVTLHREENTDYPEELQAKLKDLIRLSQEFKIVWPLMPRVRKNLEKFGLWEKLQNSGIIITKPQGYLEFLKLQKYAKVIITDSGSVQEESLILGTPCLVSRLATERPETIAAGATIMANTNMYENALKALALPLTWDKNALNPTGKSPSLNIFEDIMEKMQNGFFKNSRSYEALKSNPIVRETYNKQ